MTGKCSCKIDLKDIEVDRIKNKKCGEERNESGKIKCYKCENKAIINSRVRTCEECFINLFSKNFRANLRTKCLNKVEKGRFLAILASGDYVSTSLIHLLFSRNKDRHYKEESGEVGVGNNGKTKGVRRITDSDDIKLRLIVNVENPVNEEEFRLRSNRYFKLVESVFLKFSEEVELKCGTESDAIMESEISGVTLASIKSCYFLHKKKKLDERERLSVEAESSNKCTQECGEFIERCKRVYERDEDLSMHIWRSVRLRNLKKYVENHRNNYGMGKNQHINSKINASGIENDVSNANASHSENATKKCDASANGGSKEEKEKLRGWYLLCAETMDQICKQTVYLTCLGLGDRVSHTSAFVDEVSLEGVKMLRPLKTFSNKELAFYHRINKLDQLGTMHGAYKSTSSILGCINQFTEELSTRNSGGVHNINKVTNKLISTPKKQRCSVCEVYGQEEGHATNETVEEYVCNGCSYFELSHSEPYEYFKNKFIQARSHESEPKAADKKYISCEK